MGLSAVGDWRLAVAYTLDAVGNRTERVDDLGTHTYTYDDLHRLTEVTYPGPATTTYDLDAFGNRESMTEASRTTTCAYDGVERLRPRNAHRTSAMRC